MRIRDWHSLLSSCPRRKIGLRAAASRRRLHVLERTLGARLPDGYRNLLRITDGARFGEQRLFGTPELWRWLEHGAWPRHARMRPGLLLGPELRRAQGREAPRRPQCEGSASRRAFVPIGPLGNCALEWLELASGRVHAFERGETLEPGAGVVLYADFVDWVLDALWDVHFESDLEPLAC